MKSCHEFTLNYFSQADRQAADDRIRREQEKVEKALQAAKAGFDKEKQMKDLGIQVDSLKVQKPI